MDRTPADRPDHPRAAERFNEEQATYAVRGADQPDLEQGVAAIREVWKTLPTRPGVYRMQDARGDVLYVGKARVLKNRVTNYTQVRHDTLALTLSRAGVPVLDGTPNALVAVRGALAYRDAESGKLVISSSTQNPYRLREAVAGILGLAVEDVRVIVPDVGGGFGPKGGIYPEEILVAAAALRLGRAVKWVETRREDLLSTGQDREQDHEVTIGFRRDGTIVGIDGTFLADVGAYPLQGDGWRWDKFEGPAGAQSAQVSGIKVGALEVGTLDHCTGEVSAGEIGRNQHRGHGERCEA